MNTPEDALTVLQADLDQAAVVAADIGADANSIDAYTEEFLRTPGSLAAIEAATLRAALFEAVECHRDSCVELDCCLCEHLRGAVAQLTALLRLSVNEELNRRLVWEPTRPPPVVGVARRPEGLKVIDPTALGPAELEGLAEELQRRLTENSGDVD